MSRYRVVFLEEASEHLEDMSRGLLELTDAEADTLRRLGLGESLWRLGDRSFHVLHVLGPAERPLVDTDARMG